VFLSMCKTSKRNAPRNWTEQERSEKSGICAKAQPSSKTINHEAAPHRMLKLPPPLKFLFAAPPSQPRNLNAK